MRAVVTGSHGYIGRHLCKALVDRGDSVHRIDLKIGRDIMACELPDADRVYHLAAQTDAYSTDAANDALVNILGSIRIFQHYGDKVVFTSSAMVNYPFNPYAISKRAAENYAALYKAAIVRLPNVFGRGGHSLIDHCEMDDQIVIYGSGKQVRTYQHIDAVIDKLLNAEKGVEKSTLTIIDGVNLSVNEVVARFDKPIRYLPARAGDLLWAVQVV